MDKFKYSRGSYLVLAIVFLNNGFTGIGAVSVGIKRLIIFHDGEKFINHHECVLNVCLLSFVIASFKQKKKQIKEKRMIKNSKSLDTMQKSFNPPKRFVLLKRMLSRLNIIVTNSRNKISGDSPSSSSIFCGWIEFANE